MVRRWFKEEGGWCGLVNGGGLGLIETRGVEGVFAVVEIVCCDFSFLFFFFGSILYDLFGCFELGLCC